MSQSSKPQTTDELRLDLQAGGDLRKSVLKKIIKGLEKDLKKASAVSATRILEKEAEDVQKFLNRSAQLEILAPDIALCVLDKDAEIFKDACGALDLIFKSKVNIADTMPGLARRALQEDERAVLIRTMLMRWAETNTRIAHKILETIDTKGIRPEAGSDWYKLYKILGLDSKLIEQRIKDINEHFANWQKSFGDGKQDCPLCSQTPKTQEDSQSGEDLSQFIKRLYHVVEDIEIRGQSGDVDIMGCGGCGQLYKRFSESHDLAGFHSNTLVISKNDFEAVREEVMALARVGDEYKLVPFVSSLHITAEDGSMVSQFELGLSFAEGKGEKQSYVEALKWFHKAAEQGHSQSMCNIGTFYFQAWGVERDYKISVEWFRKAAEMGLAQAQYMLGYMYDEGLGVEFNKEEATKWFKKAAEQGDEMAVKTMSMRTNPFRCPQCSSTDVEEGGIYEFNIYTCRSCGFRQTVSIIYPETDWKNYG